MEAVAEHPVLNSTIDDVKTSLGEELPTNVADSNVCHKSNGVDCTVSCIDDKAVEPITELEMASEVIVPEVPKEIRENSETIQLESAIGESTGEIDTENNISDSKPETVESINETVETINEAVENIDESIEHIEGSDPKEGSTVLTDTEDKEIPIKHVESITESKDESNADVNKNDAADDPIVKESQAHEDQESHGNELVLGSTVELSSSTTTINDGVHFETEVLVEKEDNDIHESVVQETIIIESETIMSENTNNILSELGDSMELSEVLQSSDVANNVENNNSASKEVFNKEELLDILEGNDVNQSLNSSNDHHHDQSELVSEKALKQLSMLKMRRKSKKNKPKEELLTVKEERITKDNTDKKSKEKDNIVNVLVMDWDDEEPTDRTENKNETVEESADDTVQSQDAKDVNEEPSGRSSVDSNLSEDRQIKCEDESPPKRLGRVIKKKVIFDPDNPDTFTKTKTPKTKEIQSVKEQTPVKKGKVEPTPQRMKSRSPTAKLQWKKPSPRNSKQNKRLTEVDKLLMDEGAVNMIYQLTPEAPKGRKNVKTKAEFIKKIQSSTPEGKEMKFRERKKEAKYDDGEAKKILGAKQRTSLSSSIKSPSVCEDFETHSADDSIIYRRHSSSSYSSSCMSPRRLSDVENNSQNTKPTSVPQENSATINHDPKVPQEDIFMSETTTTPTNAKIDLINKEDCLSIKEKLNSRLSLALNKRKRESTKTEKPVKQKKVKTEEELAKSDKPKEFKFVSINIDQHLAEICLQKTGLKDSVEVLKELENAIKTVDNNPDISVTLLSSQCGTLCSSLDLSLLLHEDTEIRVKNAYELAESVRSLLATVSAHSKLVCCGVWGACSGVSLALVALCDVALASERATFALAAAAAPALPAAAALASPHRALPRSLVNDLVIFGRRVSAAEALGGGLVSRTLWPERFDDQVRRIVRDLAHQPMHALLLKKRLLSLKKSDEAQANFLSCLESERDLLVEYWTSVEGQELLRAALDAA